MPDTLVPLKFAEAIAWAKARGVVLSETYYGELQGLARAMAFTVTGLAKLDQLQAVKDSLDANLESGESFGQWKNRVRAGEVPLDLPAHRLELIFRNNIQGNYNRGRCEQQRQHVDTRPWYLYDAVNDSRTRPAHAAMDGMVARHDDPIWDRWTPPCGHACRCRRIQLSDAQARRFREADQRRLREDPQLAAERGRAEPDKGWDYSVCAEPTEGLRRAIEQRRDQCHQGGRFALAPDICHAFARQALEDLATRLARGWTLDDLVQQTLGRAYPDLAGAVQSWAAASRVPIEQAVTARAMTDYATARAVNRILWYVSERKGIGLPAKPEVWSPLVQAMLEFHVSVPLVQATLQRGVWRGKLPAGFLAAHKPGAIVQYTGFTACSRFGGETLGHDITLLIHASGVDLEPLSLFPRQREIQLRPGIQLRVLAVDWPILELEEVEAHRPVPLDHQFSL